MFKSLRLFALQRDPMHPPTKPLIIVYSDMDRTAIVPIGNAAYTPAEATGEFGLYLMSKQILEDWRAFFLGHALEMGRMRDVDIEGLAPGFGVGSDGGMFRNEAMLLIAAGGAN